MKIILIGENHVDALGPNFLYNALLTLKQLQIPCALALEVPSLDRIDNLYFTEGFHQTQLLLARLQRKLLILSAMMLYPSFAADLASQEEDNSLREEIMAAEILVHHADITVMLVGVLHLENLSQLLKKNGAEVLCFMPKYMNCLHITHYVANEHGFFYNDEPENRQVAQKRIANFTHASAYAS